MFTSQRFVKKEGMKKAEVSSRRNAILESVDAARSQMTMMYHNKHKYQHDVKDN